MHSQSRGGSAQPGGSRGSGAWERSSAERRAAEPSHSSGAGGTLPAQPAPASRGG